MSGGARVSRLTAEDNRWKRVARVERNARILERLREGLETQTVAEFFGLSTAVVSKLKAEAGLVPQGVPSRPCTARTTRGLCGRLTRQSRADGQPRCGNHRTGRR